MQMENTAKVVPHYNSICTVSRLAAINIRVQRKLVLTRISKSASRHAEACTRGPGPVIAILFVVDCSRIAIVPRYYAPLSPLHFPEEGIALVSFIR